MQNLDVDKIHLLFKGHASEAFDDFKDIIEQQIGVIHRMQRWADCVAQQQTKAVTPTNSRGRVDNSSHKFEQLITDPEQG